MFYISLLFLDCFILRKYCDALVTIVLCESCVALIKYMYFEAREVESILVNVSNGHKVHFIFYQNYKDFPPHPPPQMKTQQSNWWVWLCPTWGNGSWLLKNTTCHVRYIYNIQEVQNPMIILVWKINHKKTWRPDKISPSVCSNFSVEKWPQKTPHLF